MKNQITFEEARIALGLQPFEGFYHPKAPVLEAHSSRERGTGRTTKMLVEAVVQSQTKKVAIVGWSISYSYDLTRQARNYACKLGLNPDQIVLPNDGWKAEQVFTDHYINFSPLRKQ